MTNKKITKDMKISELIEKYPKSVDVLMKYNFPCIGCAMAQFETIEEGVLATHGEGEKVLKKIIEEINKKYQID